MRYYSQTTGNCYLTNVHGENMPQDARPISDQRYDEVIANPAPNKIRSHDAYGLPTLIDPAPLIFTTEQLCKQIDAAADAARLAVAGDPLRATEYERAAAEAQAFKDAGYPAESVPRTVAAWAINGRTAQQSADSILAESAAYTEALYRLREIRLTAKEQVRLAIKSNDTQKAEIVIQQAINSVTRVVDGVGNSQK